MAYILVLCLIVILVICCEVTYLKIDEMRTQKQVEKWLNDHSHCGNCPNASRPGSVCYGKEELLKKLEENATDNGVK